MARSRAFCPRKGMVPLKPRPKFQPETPKRKKDATDDESDESDENPVSKPATKKYRPLPLETPLDSSTGQTTTWNRAIQSISPSSSPSTASPTSALEQENASISDSEGQENQASTIDTSVDTTIETAIETTVENNPATVSPTQMRYPPAHFKPSRPPIAKGRPSRQSLENVNTVTPKGRAPGRKACNEDEDQRRFACKQCDSRFKRSEHLHRHIQSRHTDRKQFQCTTCGKFFSRSDNRNQHQRIHFSKWKPSVKEDGESDENQMVEEETDDNSDEEGGVTVREEDVEMNESIEAKATVLHETSDKSDDDDVKTDESIEAKDTPTYKTPFNKKPFPSNKPRLSPAWQPINHPARSSTKKDNKSDFNPFST
ncbi:Hypothetical protein R9X50_00728500 [Acrodontium crateriforme]|uniref:C2H2-type domain-containing protein n=1 Tax=Acrodontium crateriforme TaxID=150365 RepID=A0AAQ3RAM3_9PEZI|nr:Hypothetical protein R9X50_00728500 [Acrodontium crateriforme]